MWAGKVGGLPHRNSQRGGRRGGPKGRRSPQSSTRGIGCVDVPCTQLTNQWPHQHLTRVSFLARSLSHALSQSVTGAAAPNGDGWSCVWLWACFSARMHSDGVIKHRLNNKSMHVHRQEELVGHVCNEWDTNEEMFPFLLIPQLHDDMTSTAWTAKWQHLTRKTYIYIYTYLETALLSWTVREAHGTGWGAMWGVDTPLYPEAAPGYGAWRCHPCLLGTEGCHPHWQSVYGRPGYYPQTCSRTSVQNNGKVTITPMHTSTAVVKGIMQNFMGGLSL